jgi:hypothetical protein
MIVCFKFSLPRAIGHERDAEPFDCHAGEGRHPYSRGLCVWIPAFAGMNLVNFLYMGLFCRFAEWVRQTDL